MPRSETSSPARTPPVRGAAGRSRENGSGPQSDPPILAVPGGGAPCQQHVWPAEQGPVEMRAGPLGARARRGPEEDHTDSGPLPQDERQPCLPAREASGARGTEHRCVCVCPRHPVHASQDGPPPNSLRGQLCAGAGVARGAPGGNQSRRDSRPGPRWAGGSVQSWRCCPCGLRGPRRAPVLVVHSCALVAAALLLLPPGLLVPQGDVPGGGATGHPAAGRGLRARPARPGRGARTPGPGGGGPHRRKKRQTVQVSTSTEPSVQHWAM